MVVAHHHQRVGIRSQNRRPAGYFLKLGVGIIIIIGLVASRRAAEPGLTIAAMQPQVTMPADQALAQ